MKTATRKATAAAPAAALVTIALAFWTPAAAPSDTRVVAVFPIAACDSEPCRAGRDPEVSPGASVRGAIEVHVRSSASVLGLDFVRLEAQFGALGSEEGDPRWVCIEQWDSPGETNFARHIRWDTVRWPKVHPDWGCPETTRHFHGEPTPNRPFKLRALARERINGEQETSPAFDFRVANPPARPQWVVPPRAATGGDGRPTVTLEWKANPEPDVIEYHFARTGPGRTAEFVVDAKRPQAQGCRRLAVGKPPQVSYVCADSAFPATGFAGTYRYAVFAYRPAFAGKACSLKPQPCFESPAASVRSVVLRGGAPTGAATTATPDPTVAPVVTAEPAPSAPAPVAVEPGENREQLAAAPAKNAGPPLPALAFGFLTAAGAAATLVRLARARRRSP